MFSWCAEYCMPRLCYYFSNIKSTLTSAVFFFFSLAGSYQLQVKLWALDQLKESKSASTDKAYCHSMQFFFQFCDSST